jgi:hypothetical protein
MFLGRVSKISITLLGISCLMLFVVGATAGDFRLVELQSETRVGRIETFIAAEAFKVGGTIGGRTLSAVGWNFAEHFLSVVEKNVLEGQVSAWTLLYTAGDKSLIEASYGEEGTVHFLAHIHHLMELSDKGPSHLDWRSNFAYMRSPIDHRVWAVHWNVNYANEWNIGAVYVPHPHLDWQSGSRLFSSRGLPGMSSCADGADARFGCRDGVGNADFAARVPQKTR